jgi:hypothetical protein
MSLKENDIYNEAMMEVELVEGIGPQRQTFLCDKIREVMPELEAEVGFSKIWLATDHITEKHYKFLLWNYYNDKESFKLKINELMNYDKPSKQSN